jgi:hypothetical protein
MAIQTINLGNYANDGTGDDLRVAFTKVNANFAALDASAAIANGVNVGTGVGIFFAKDTTNLQFKTLTSTNNSVTISSTGNTVDLAAVTRLQSDLTPTLGANLNLNNKYVYGGDIQSTVYGYNVPVSAMFNSLLVESNNLNVDMGSFLTPTGYETDGLAGKKGYLLDWGLFSDTPINDKLNFGTFGEHLTGGIGQLTLAGNLTTTGAYNLTLATTANTNLTLPTSGTLTTTANNLSAFAATTSAQLAGVISDETGTGKLVFATSPTLVSPTIGAAVATSLTFPDTSTLATGAVVRLSTTGQTITDTSGAINYTLKIASGTTGAVFGIGTGNNAYGIANDALNNSISGYVPYTVSASSITFKAGGTPATAIAINGTDITNSLNTTLSSSSLIFSGPISAPAWTTTGIRHVSIPATLTDTTSTGTVANAYTNSIGGNTIAATNATTYTNYATMFVNSPTAGTNVTFTNAWSIITAGNILLRGSTIDGPASTTAFPSATTLGIGNASGTTTIAGRTSTTNLSRSGLEIAVPNYIAVGSTATYALSTTVTDNVLVVSTTALTATLTFPSASLIDGQRLRFTVTTNTVTLALTAGPTLVGTFAGSVTAPTTFTYVYRTSNTTWYRI